MARTPGGNPLAPLVRQIRLTLLPLEWKTKYPRFHMARWFAVGIIVASLTGNLPYTKLNPLAPSKETQAQKDLSTGTTADKAGHVLIAVLAYPVPLAIAVTHWVDTEAVHVCTALNLGCTFGPSTYQVKITKKGATTPTTLKTP